MKVKELIEQLQQIEDKDLEVVYYDQCSDGGPWAVDAINQKVSRIGCKIQTDRKIPDYKFYEIDVKPNQLLIELSVSSRY